jgi:hypothetical protein
MPGAVLARQAAGRETLDWGKTGHPPDTAGLTSQRGQHERGQLDVDTDDT